MVELTTAVRFAAFDASPPLSQRRGGSLALIGAFPAIITRRAFGGEQPDRRQLHPLALQSLSRNLEQGRRRLRQVGRRRLCDTGHRGQQREGHRRHQGDSRQDRRQLRHQRRSERQPGRAADRAGLQGRGRLCRHPVEQAQRSASLGFQSQLRRPHLLQRRSLRQGDGGNADQGDGRQGRHRRARRHRIQRAGDRTEGRPHGSAQGQSGRATARHAGRQLVGDRGAAKDQRVADPVRRQDRRHLGGQRRHGARRRRSACGATAEPGRFR